MKDEKTQVCSLHKSKIGGQALIEGVMMNGVHKGAMACRLPNGEIDIEEWDKDPVTAWYRKTPIVRGIFNFVISMKDGYRCLMKSAEKQITEDEATPEDEKLSDKAMSAIMTVAVVVSFIFAIGLFVFLPKWIVSFFGFSKENASMGTRIIISLCEGFVKIAVFVGYLAFTRLMKDLSRTYEYHGAEHKTIACFEAGLPLTVENVKKQVRFHPRCGTSFIFITLFISILVMCFVPFTVVWQRVVSSIILIPVMVGISYELIRIAGRYTNLFTRIISAPGLWIQRITTKEPDSSQIECAIAAMKPCIPENLEDNKW